MNIYMYMHTYVCIHMYVCMCVYPYVHTYVHVCSHWWLPSEADMVEALVFLTAVAACANDDD